MEQKMKNNRELTDAFQIIVNVTGEFRGTRTDHQNIANALEKIRSKIFLTRKQLKKSEVK
jgi:uncharacterized membrane protein